MSEYLVAVTLYVRRGMEQQFHEFERQALRIAARHGGRLLRAVRLSDTAQDLQEPYEFHLLSFPSDDSFRRFREDPERVQLRGLGDAAIGRTEILAGGDDSARYEPDE